MKTKFFTLLLLAFIGWSTANAQVGIGTTSPDASAALDVTSTSKGLLPPRMTTADRDLINSPADGLTIYNTTDNCLQFYLADLFGWFDVCDDVFVSGPVLTCSDQTFIPPFLTASATTVIPVPSPSGLTWMDRNLGAQKVALYEEDCFAYGNLYQWGRSSDGHENRNSTVFIGPVANTYTGSDFVANENSNTDYDWLIDAQRDDTRWNGITKGVHDPCPPNYRVPTAAEWTTEKDSWTVPVNETRNSMATAFASPLKIAAGGLRFGGGSFGSRDERGVFWTSDTDGAGAVSIMFERLTRFSGYDDRVNGNAIRCIKYQ